MTPLQIYELNSNVNEPPTKYGDPQYLKNCRMRCDREEFFDLLKFWMALAADHNITWFITYGTLVGAWRHRDCLPWDHDLDLGIFQSDETKIRGLQTPRGRLRKDDDEEANLVARPGSFCLFNGAHTQRQTCEGKNVTSNHDVCSFCSPLARLFYTEHIFMDLYLYRLLPLPDTNPRDGKRILYDEGKYDISKGKQKFTDPDTILPLRKCTFMGLTVLCPRKIKEYIKHIYGSTKVPQTCENGRWFSSPGVIIEQ